MQSLNTDDVYTGSRATNEVSFLDDKFTLQEIILDFLANHEKLQVDKTVDNKELANVFRYYADARKVILGLDTNVLQTIFCAGMMYQSERAREGVPMEK